jgi:hypothetical protein
MFITETTYKSNQEKARKVIHDNLTMFRNLNEPIFNKWAKYLMPMLNKVIAGKQYDENNKIIDEWVTDKREYAFNKMVVPSIEKKCVKCKDHMDVSQITVYYGKPVCISCREDMSFRNRLKKQTA